MIHISWPKWIGLLQTPEAAASSQRLQVWRTAMSYLGFQQVLPKHNIACRCHRGARISSGAEKAMLLWNL